MKALYENNFWDMHSELKIIEEFNKVYTADKSKKKETSSRTMWAVDFAYNPESRFFNLPDKLDIISNLLGRLKNLDSGLYAKSIAHIVRELIDFCLDLSAV